MSSVAPGKQVRVIGVSDGVSGAPSRRNDRKYCPDHLTEHDQRHHEPAPVDGSMIWIKAVGLKANA